MPSGDFYHHDNSLSSPLLSSGIMNTATLSPPTLAFKTVDLNKNYRNFLQPVHKQRKKIVKCMPNPKKSLNITVATTLSTTWNTKSYCDL